MGLKKMGVILVFCAALTGACSNAETKNKGQIEAQKLLDTLWTKCGDNYVVSNIGMLSDAKETTIYKKATIEFSDYTQQISEADKLNGLEWYGDLSMNFGGPYKEFHGGKTWDSSWQESNFNRYIHIEIKKIKGKDWEVELNNKAGGFIIPVQLSCDDILTPKDDKKAVESLTKAAEQGNADIPVLIYQRNAELRKRERDAEQGNVEAQLNLGLMYRDGKGMTQDTMAAEMWLSRAAEQGNIEALYNLGVMYEKGHDYKTAVELYTRAAEQGNAEAQNNLGMMYAQGRGVGRDNKKAAEWFAKSGKYPLTKSAKQGDAEAQRPTP